MSQLRIQRHLKDMTQTELSKKSGISRVTIAKLEKGDIEIASIKTLKKLADALNINVSELLDN